MPLGDCFIHINLYIYIKASLKNIILILNIFAVIDLSLYKKKEKLKQK